MTQKISIAGMQPDRQTIAGNGWLQNSVKTVATLSLLLLALPLNITLTAIALLAAILVRPFQSRTAATNPQTILVSGGKMTKALQPDRSITSGRSSSNLDRSTQILVNRASLFLGS